MANQDKFKSDEHKSDSLAPTTIKSDGEHKGASVAPANIPLGDVNGPGPKEPQDISSTATPNVKATGEPMPVINNPDAPHGKQWYRIKGPGGVKLNGVFYQEGVTLQIAAADAQSIDGYLELLPGAPEPTV